MDIIEIIVWICGIAFLVTGILALAAVCRMYTEKPAPPELPDKVVITLRDETPIPRTPSALRTHDLSKAAPPQSAPEHQPPVQIHTAYPPSLGVREDNAPLKS